jgi:wyosine [tRNA(Phe)-imidazoG37] synthetase (radical SAM superfamily)
MASKLYTQHERSFAANRFVYPVLSRRSGGISVGINLNPDKICNFGCIYCQVNRVSQSETRFIDSPQMLQELAATLQLVTSNGLYESDKFRATPPAMRRLTDIAFSGDGEPTTHRNFDEIVAAVADVRDAHGLAETPLVLITNASMFQRDHVRRALQIFDARHGEIWAKLDAGTQPYYELVNRAPFSFESVLQNITAAACERPLVIQSLFMRVHGQPPPQTEWHAYCQRLREIVAAGGKLKLIQIYTVARTPAESYVSSLTDGEVDQMVDFVTRETGLRVAGYYGAEYPPPA